MSNNVEIGTSFDLPERLTVALFEAYEIEHVKNTKAAKVIYGDELTSTRELAIIFQSALEAGLYHNWQSVTMPDPDTDNINEQEASVILWAAEEMGLWLARNRKIPKVSFWTALILLWGKLTQRRPNLSKANGATATRRYRDS